MMNIFELKSSINKKHYQKWTINLQNIEKRIIKHNIKQHNQTKKLANIINVLTHKFYIKDFSMAGNSGLSAIRKFNRYELKYLISYDTAQKLQQDLKKYVIPDSYSKNENGLYTLSSLYYDTQDYRFYWEKVDGLKYRRKLRIRQYETNEGLHDDSIVYVEIKQRVDRVTQKRRVPMKYKDAMNFCNHLIIPEFDKRDEATIFELYQFIKQNNLKPSCITSYMRNAYFGTDYDTGLRITFDTNIRYRKNNLDLADKEIGEFMISPDMVIMEVKANERVPYRLTEMIAHYNFRLIRVSKYCQGLETSAAVPRSVYYLGD